MSANWILWYYVGLVGKMLKTVVWPEYNGGVVKDQEKWMQSNMETKNECVTQSKNRNWGAIWSAKTLSFCCEKSKLYDKKSYAKIVLNLDRFQLAVRPTSTRKKHHGTYKNGAAYTHKWNFSTWCSRFIYIVLHNDMDINCFTLVRTLFHSVRFSLTQWMRWIAAAAAALQYFSLWSFVLNVNA